MSNCEGGFVARIKSMVKENKKLKEEIRDKDLEIHRVREEIHRERDKVRQLKVRSITILGN